MQRYQCHPQELIELEAPGVLEGTAVSNALTPQAVACGKGTALKRLEDKLDGLTCVMAAWLASSNHETLQPIDHDKKRRAGEAILSHYREEP